MTSSLPSGDGTSPGTGPSSALDEDALPDTGTEPDTAETAAGQDQISAAPDAPHAAGPGADDTSTPAETVEAENPAAAQDDLDPDSRDNRPSDKVELDGPAVDNEEVRRATEDLRSSEDSIAEAREYAEDVRSHTEPGASPTGM